MNAKSPYVKLSMLKTINKPKAAAGDAIFDVRLFFCLSAVNKTASGFRWVLFPAFGQHKEVMLLKHKCPSPRICGLLKPCRVLRSATMTAFWRSSSRAFCQSAGSAKARSSCWIRLPPRSPITPPTTPCRNFSIVWSAFPISMRRSCQSAVSAIMTIWN